MSDAFVGEIRLFAGNFPPVNWVFCQGQTLKISEYQEIYSLIGVIYGGDGATNFKLPDLRGRVMIGQGPGPGLTPRTLGAIGGASTVQLSTANLPAHNHAFSVSNLQGTTNTPQATYSLAVPAAQSGGTIYAYVAPTATGITTQAFDPATILPADGGSQPHSNVMPYQALNAIICLRGIYPTRQ